MPNIRRGAIIGSGGSGGGGGGGTTAVSIRGSVVAGAAISDSDFKGDYLSVEQFGAAANGVANDSPAFIAAVAKAKAIGGASIYVPKGIYKLNDPILIDNATANVKFYGEGTGSIIRRGANLASGEGLFGVYGKDITFEDLLIDGGVTTAVGISYSTITDPMQPSLSDNTSVWVHGGAERINFSYMTIQHTGGYAILLDATSVGDIDNVTINNCNFLNNRPHLFGLGADLSYGSWTGGVHYQGNGTTFAVKNLSATDCTWSRNTGNCFWGHLYAFSKIHSNIRVVSCHFIDCGLDGVLVGGVVGGCVEGCTFRRIGYVCTDDTSPSTPRWLSGLNATALDTSGLVKCVNHTGNTFISINGGCIDGDGLGYGNVHGNVMLIPAPGDPEYTEDSIASFGPGNVGDNWTYGIQLSNSQNLSLAAVGVTITGNTFLNMGAGAIRLYAARNCEATANSIIHPPTPHGPPISLGNIGTGTNQRARNNVVTDNMISWNPPSDVPAVVEDSSIAAFSAGDKNWVANNRILSAGAGVPFEFQKDPVTSSITRFVLSAMVSPLTQASETHIQRETGLTRWYKKVGGTITSIMTLQDSVLLPGPAFGGPMLNVTSGTGTGGVLSTGARTTSAFDDAISTGKGYFDAFACLTDTTFLAADANQLGATVAMLRFRSSVGYIEQSLTVTAGARNWIPLTGIAAGADKFVQYGKLVSGTLILAGDSNFTWDYTAKVLTITGTTATAGIVALTSYIQSAEGFVSLSNSYQSIQTPTGGFNGAGIGITGGSSNKGGYVQIVPLNYAGNFPTALTNASFGGNDALLWVGAVNGTVSPVTAVTLNTNIAINSAVGFSTLNTLQNSIQAPVGGVSARWLVASDSLFFLEEAAPALSGSGQARIYMNSTSHTVLISTHGGAYVPLVGGGSGVAGSNQHVQFNDAGVFGGTSNFTFDKTNQIVTVTGKVAQASIVSLIGYIQSDGGFVTSLNSYQSIQTPNGGFNGAGLGLIGAGSKGGYIQLVPLNYAPGTFPVALTSASFGATDVLLWAGATNGTVTPLTSTGLHTNAFINAAGGFATASSLLIAVFAPNGGVVAARAALTDYLSFAEESAPALSPSGTSRFYMNSTTHVMMISQHGGAYVPLVGSSSAAGLDTYVQYNSGGSFGGSANLVWDNTNQILTVTGKPTSYGIHCVVGYIWSDGGLLVGSSAQNAVQVTTGGVSAKWLIANDSLFLISETVPSLSGAGQARIYLDSGSLTLRVSINGSAYGPLSSANAAGSTGNVQFNTANAFDASANFNWNNSTRQLVISTTAGVAGIAVGSGFIQSDQGFLVSNVGTFWNSIQTPGGIVARGSIQVGPNYTFDQSAAAANWLIHGMSTINGTAAFVLDAYDTTGFNTGAVAAFVGRRAVGSPGGFLGSIPTNTTILSIGARGSTSGGSMTGSSSAVMNFVATENWTPSAIGCEIYFATIPNGTASVRPVRLRISNSGLIQIPGTTNNAGAPLQTTSLQIDSGWVTAADTVVGGFHASGNQFNVLQAPSGGCYVGLGFTCDQALYPRTFGTGATPNTPGGGYAGFGHRSGATFWYWNPSTSSWGFVDFSAAGGGGVTSLNGITGAVTLIQGTGVTIGVNTPFAGQITISIGQSVGVLNSPVFAGIQSNGTCSAVLGFISGATRISNNGGQLTGSGLLMRQGAGATGFNFWVQDNGNGTWRYRAGGTGTITDNVGNQWGFEGGVLTKLNGVAFNQFDVLIP